MREIFFSFFLVILLITGCCGKDITDEDQMISGNAISGSAIGEENRTEKQADREDTINKESVPYLIKKVKDSSVGVELQGSLEYSSEMVEGDDSSYYYFREKEKKIVFYRNNKIKICEMEKPKGEIWGFVKYKNCIWLQMEKESNVWVAALNINTGQLQFIKEIDSPDIERVVLYRNYFYCITDENHITRYNLRGKKINAFSIGKEKVDFPDTAEMLLKKQVEFQKIVDGKIYYTVCMSEAGGTTKIMRCGLDGSKQEILYQYTRGEEEKKWCRRLSSTQMTIYHNYIYILDVYTTYGSFYRIPLHGGNIEKITRRSVEEFSLSGNKIFCLENGKAEGLYMITEDLEVEKKISEEQQVKCFVVGDDNVYFVNKDAQGIYKVSIKGYVAPEKLTDISVSQLYYSDGCLVAKKRMEEDERKIEELAEYDIGPNRDYAPEYCWLNSKGNIIGVLENVKLKKSKYFYW